MKINCTYSVLESVHKIVPNPRNTNKHNQKQIALLAKIIDFQGWRHPIIISKRSGFVVAGHARLEAAKLLNYELCPVDYQEFENEAQEYAFLESDNHIAELAEHDKNKMLINLRELDFKLDLDLIGIPDFKLPELELKIDDLKKEEIDTSDNSVPIHNDDEFCYEIKNILDYRCELTEDDSSETRFIVQRMMLRKLRTWDDESFVSEYSEFKQELQE